MPSRRRKIAATALATFGLSSLTPVQQGAMLVTAGTAALWASPALAQNTIPGVGVIVKSNSGRGAIIVPSDANGEVRLTGLEPGDYTLQVPCSGPRGCHPWPERDFKTKVRVERDGRLALAAWEDSSRTAPGATAPSPRRWAQAIAFAGPGGHQPANAVVLDMRAAFHVSPPIPCARPRPGQPSTCGRIRNHVDVNASSAEEMTRHATTLTREAARVILAERTRAPFTDAGDFARRICPKVEIDFDDAAVRMGSTSILMKRSGDPKANGFKCGPREEAVRLFWVTFPLFNLAGWL
jgi:hypothetical protein